MEFTKKDLKFDLHDIGSEIIDQLSTDIYTKPESILREVVKNAYDSYLYFHADDFEDNEIPREIIITRSRDNDGVGHLLINDQGVGQTLDRLKRNAQISISHTPDEVNYATGFRGLGSWANLGAGSKIILVSRHNNEKFVNRLTFDVKEIYKILGPSTTLHDILNNPRCISFGQATADGDTRSHFTTVEIVCDGPRKKINNKYEINRLHQFTDPADTELRQILLRACPIPFASDSPYQAEVATIYQRTHYVPTPLVLHAEKLYRRLPLHLKKFEKHEIKIGGHIAAIGWTAENPDEVGTLAGKIDRDSNTQIQTNLAGQSLQLLRLNVPIGPKGIFANNEQARLLNWYVGEIHIVAKDIRPNAEGDDLRAGTAREAFIKELRDLYDKLAGNVRSKSTKINSVKKLKDGVKASQAWQKAQAQPHAQKIGDQIELQNRLKTCIETLEETKTSKGATADGENPFDSVEVQTARKEARRALKEAGLLDMLKQKAQPAANKKSKAAVTTTAKVAAGSGTGQKKFISIDDFQARLGQAIPKLKQIGLDDLQIKAVLKVIQTVLAGNSGNTNG